MPRADAACEQAEQPGRGQRHPQHRVDGEREGGGALGRGAIGALGREPVEGSDIARRAGEGGGERAGREGEPRPHRFGPPARVAAATVANTAPSQAQAAADRPRSASILRGAREAQRLGHMGTVSDNGLRPAPAGQETASRQAPGHGHEQRHGKDRNDARARQRRCRHDEAAREGAVRQAEQAELRKV